MAKEEENRIVVDHVYKTFNVYMDKANSLKEKMLFWNRNRKEKREVLQGINLKIKQKCPTPPKMMMQGDI